MRVDGPRKRYYKRAAVEATAGGFALTLDRRPVKTPARAPLVVPSRALVDALAAEWEAQGDTIRPHAMPLVTIACTAIDRVAHHRDQVVQDLASYAETDLVCYRADSPPRLVDRQREIWQPLLDWACLRFDARLAVTTGVIPVTQLPNSVTALRRAVEEHSDFELAPLAVIVRAAGSLIIALALAEGRLSVEDAFAASQLDETYQMETWGEDIEAVRRRSALEADLESAARFLRLLQA